jgi:putative inorganic carbon (hco3(-)) transporter
MPIESSKEKDREPLKALHKAGGTTRDGQPSLKPPGSANNASTSGEPQNLVNLSYTYGKEPEPRVPPSDQDVPANDDVAGTAPKAAKQKTASSGKTKTDKKVKKEEKDRELLGSDRWLVRNGHNLTYIGLFLFSILVLFRPYEIVPALGFLSATAYYFAIASLVLFFPSQLAVEGNLTMLSTEVKAILAMTLIALLTIPISKDPGVAWLTFNDTYIKAVVIFIVLVNVVRTRKRLMGLMWLSFGIGIYLGLSAMQMYWEGKFSVEEYRVGATDVKGMFGNPNEMALHFVMMTPLVISLGIASKNNKLMRYIYFGMAVLFVAANMVTFSRGGFLGLLACSLVLAWKFGRKQRLNVSIVSVVLGGIVILAAPGNYGRRLLSIFIPALDPVGSSNQRSELLTRSLQVTARNPWGIGIGNFPIVGVRNLQTHNGFTQVSSELGILGLFVYLVFMISPFRKLAAIERTLHEQQDLNWFYYLAIGLQASIIGYMVSSFFASVAYNWFIYYLIAYAVAFRRIYSLESGLTEEVKAAPLWGWRAAETK